MSTSERKRCIVLGVGAVGSALKEILESAYHVEAVDLAPVNIEGPVDAAHVCFPFHVPNFIDIAVGYAEKYRPKVLIIESTVVPGTTRAIAERVACPVAYSPVRGKHNRLAEELRKYRKFVAGVTSAATEIAAAHLGAAGFETETMQVVEALELGKVSETTYFGLQIAWAQELNRFATQVGASYEEVIRFYDEIAFLPRAKYFPGVIGGTCVVPNVHLMKRKFNAPILDAILDSNDRRKKEVGED